MKMIKTRLKVATLVILASVYCSTNALPPSPVKKQPEIGLAAAFLIPGLICGFYSYKLAKQVWKETCKYDQAIQDLNDMNVPVNREISYGGSWNTTWQTNRVSITIPTDFTQEQKDVALALWETVSSLHKESSASTALSYTLPAAIVLALVGVTILRGC